MTRLKSHYTHSYINKDSNRNAISLECYELVSITQSGEHQKKLYIPRMTSENRYSGPPKK